MTKKQFLDAVNGIDDELINEFINVPDEPRENYLDDEKPQVVYLTNEHIPFWKIVVSAAAVVFVLSVGIFAAGKFHGIQSAESNSGISLISSDVYDKLNSVVTDGHKFNTEFMSDPSSDILYTDPVIKTDDKNYAAVHISFPNSNKDEHITLHIRVERKEYLYDDGIYLLGKYKLTSVGEIIVTESKEQTYRIDYKENAAAGDEYVLGLYTTRESGELVHAEGEWLP